MLQDSINRIAELRARLEEAWQVLDLDAERGEIAALEAEASAPDFWSDQERARRESQKLSDLKKDFEGWSSSAAKVLGVDNVNAYVYKMEKK